VIFDRESQNPSDGVMLRRPELRKTCRAEIFLRRGSGILVTVVARNERRQFGRERCERPVLAPRDPGRSAPRTVSKPGLLVALIVWGVRSVVGRGVIVRIVAWIGDQTARYIRLGLASIKACRGLRRGPDASAGIEGSARAGRRAALLLADTGVCGADSIAYQGSFPARHITFPAIGSAGIIATASRAGLD
jgi:hypothetical protein